jgi:hypothetical protein
MMLSIGTFILFKMSDNERDVDFFSKKKLGRPTGRGAALDEIERRRLARESNERYKARKRKGEENNHIETLAALQCGFTDIKTAIQDSTTNSSLNQTLVGLTSVMSKILEKLGKQLYIQHLLIL